LRELRQTMDEGKVSVQTFGNVRKVRRNSSLFMGKNFVLSERLEDVLLLTL